MASGSSRLAGLSAGSARRMEIHFGPSFGAVSFGYQSLTARTRGSRIVRTDGRFDYRDIDTGEPFDMYEPFPELDCAPQDA